MKTVFCAPEFVFTQENSTGNSSFCVPLNFNPVVWVKLEGVGGRGRIMASVWNVADAIKAAVWGTAALCPWLRSVSL